VCRAAQPQNSVMYPCDLQRYINAVCPVGVKNAADLLIVGVIPLSLSCVYATVPNAGPCNITLHGMLVGSQNIVGSGYTTGPQVRASARCSRVLPFAMWGG
jgi:hypothetical protein